MTAVTRPPAEPTVGTLAQHHIDMLARCAIPADYAASLGIRSAAALEDLPDEISMYSSALPGLIYPLRHLDGSITHQFARDHREPVREGAPKPGKYLFPAGCGTWITVHPNQANRIGSAREIWVVEGTKQAIAASCYAPQHVLVLGIQGCDGWSSGGAILPEFAEVGLTSARVVIMFDRDRKSKLGVWEAGAHLTANLCLLGAEQVVYADNPGRGDDTGLDDLLGRLPTDQRADWLVRLAASGTPKAGRRPTAKPTLAGRVRPTVVCDMAAGQTVLEAEGEHGGPRVRQPIADFAGRIVESVMVRDLDNPDRVIQPILTVEVSVPTTDGTARHLVSIPDNRLGDIGLLLGQVGDGLGVSIPRPAYGSEMASALVNAIRGCEPDRTVRTAALQRTGWCVLDGEQRYLHQGGALGADGNSTGTRAHLNVVYRRIDYVSAAGKAADPAELARAVRASLDAAELLIDQTPWWASLGGLAIAECGAIPKAAIGLVAPRSSGKTLIQQTITAALSPAYAYERTVMMVAAGTENAVDGAMSGLDGCLLLVDDWCPAKDARERAQQYRALDRALRRCHGAPSKPRARVDRALDDVVLAGRSDSHPLLLLSLEDTPERSLMESVLDRMLTLHLTRETTFRPGDAAKMASLGQCGDMQVANAGYLMWLARQIRDLDEDPETAMSRWVSAIEARRSEVETEFTARSRRATPRGAKSVASLLVGLELWLAYAVAVGAHDADGVACAQTRAATLLLAALHTHNDVALGGNRSRSASVLDGLRAAVARGELAVGDAPLRPGQRRLGRSHILHGQQVLAILPDTPMAGWTADQIEHALAPLAVQTVEAGKARRTHQVRFALIERRDKDGEMGETGEAVRLYCQCIPWMVWESDGDEGGE